MVKQTEVAAFDLVPPPFARQQVECCPAHFWVGMDHFITGGDHRQRGDVHEWSTQVGAEWGCVLAGCTSDADVASRNLSVAAEQFEIERRVVFFNGITDSYLLSIEGRCSIEDQGNQLEVTCKTGPDAFKKHFLGLSDNVSYFVEQLGAAYVSVFHYRVIFKPEVIIPDIDRP